MNRYTDPLAHIRIAAPCRADWERMRGNETVRFCDECSLNVYNLSNMSKREAESLIMKTEGRLCVRFYRRTDGTILTKNCPVGLQRLTRRVRGISKAVISSALSFCAGIGAFVGLQRAQASLESFNEAGVDLIAPAPLETPGAQAEPPRENAVMMGAPMSEPVEEWANGQAVAGGIFVPRRE